jgi:hypothetical protein
MAAEKTAIQSEHPRHNIIHSRSTRPEGVVATSVEIVWPRPARHAVIAWEWDPKSRGTGEAAVAVGYQPFKCGSPSWFDNYAMTTGAGDSSRDELTDSERRIAVMADYFMLTHVYDIPARVVTRALMNIREFRDAVESSPMGSNLMCDCESIGKDPSVIEKRSWHSIHVFRRADLARTA